MLVDDNVLFQNATEYAKSIRRQVLRQDRLGHGSDGSVWKTSVPSAVKAFYRQENYEVELECYNRLKANGVEKINGLNVPVLEGFSHALKVIEITFVQPPFFLDFGKVRLDRPPSDFYDKQKLANAQSTWRDLFGPRWPDVNAVLYILRKSFGIH